MNYLHLYVEDYKVPSIQDIDSTVKFIENEIKLSRFANFDCAAGKGKDRNNIGSYIY